MEPPFTLQTSSMTPATQAAAVIAAGPGAVAERLKLDRAQVAELEAAELECNGDFFRLARWHGSVTVERTGRREFTATARGPSVRGWTKILRDRTADYAWMAAKAELVAYLERLREGSLADARERIALLTAAQDEFEALLPFGPPEEISVSTVGRLSDMYDRLDVMLSDLRELDEHLAGRLDAEPAESRLVPLLKAEQESVRTVTGMTESLLTRIGGEILHLGQAALYTREEDSDDGC